MSLSIRVLLAWLLAATLLAIVPTVALHRPQSGGMSYANDYDTTPYRQVQR